jgi:MurNAc alpha-1-phosphate uridylyltransferase
MVLAAGLGTRMRPITLTTPKPLVEVGGRALLDRALDQLVRAGVSRAIVNVHYLADQIEGHLGVRRDIDIIISDERACLLDTGGGIAAALPDLGPAPFFVSNSDSLWREGPLPLLKALRAAWRDTDMDCLLALAPVTSLGYDGSGDFHLAPDGRLTRAGAGDGPLCVNPGIYLLHPRLMANVPRDPFSMNVVWNTAIAQGRLHGITVAGEWMHVGTPQSLAEANQRLAQLEA